jgi:hypothetical protein
MSVWINRGIISPGHAIVGVASHAGLTIAIDDVGSTFRSTDGGLTWTAGNPTGFGYAGGNLVYSNGVWIQGASNTISRSADNGVTWTNIDTTVVTAGQGSLATDGAGKWLIIGNVADNTRTDLYAVSVDNGLTWVKPGISTNIGGACSPLWTGSEWAIVNFDSVTIHSQIPTSADAHTWTVNSGSTNNLFSITQAAAFVVGYNDGTNVGVVHATTIVGLITAAPVFIAGLNGPSGINAVFSDSGTYFAFDGTGGVATATNPDVWTVGTSTLTGGEAVDCVCADNVNGTVIAGGTAGSIITLALGATVPNVVGEDLTTASLAITNAGYTVGTVTLESSNIVATGKVDTQNPVGGTPEAPGFPVNLVVSTGPASIINKLTQKLLLYLHRIFDKDPHPNLAFRMQYNGTDLAWSILNGIMTLTATGGTGTSHTFNIANFTVAQLANFIAALPGYSVPYQDFSGYGQLSALVLLDSSNNTNVSNGDHVYGYTTLLWAYLDSNSSELGTAKLQIENALQQMATPTAQDEWLDYHGSFYKVPRDQSELDPNYAPRIIANVLQPRGNNVAIASAIQSIAIGAQTVRVIDAINDIGFAITYNGLIHFDGSEFYDAGLGPGGAYGFFDVDFSYDFLGPVTEATYLGLIESTVEAFRDAGTQLRAVIFRNNGSTVTIVSDSFIGGIRVIVYDDFSGSSFRLIESGPVRLLENGTARILE